MRERNKELHVNQEEFKSRAATRQNSIISDEFIFNVPHAHQRESVSSNVSVQKHTSSLFFYSLCFALFFNFPASFVQYRVLQATTTRCRSLPRGTAGRTERRGWCCGGGTVSLMEDRFGDCFVVSNHAHTGDVPSQST